MAAICNICTDRLFRKRQDRQQDISAVSCGHTFHRICLNKWWVKSKTCPNCRQECKVKIDKLYIEHCEENPTENFNEKIKELQEKLTKSESEKDRVRSTLNKKINILIKHPTAKEQILKDRIAVLKEELCSREEENNHLLGLVTQKEHALQEVPNLLAQIQDACDEKLKATIQEHQRAVCKLEKDKGDLKLAVCKLEGENDGLRCALQKLEEEKDNLKLVLGRSWQKISFLEKQNSIRSKVNEELRCQFTEKTQLLLRTTNAFNQLRIDCSQNLLSLFVERETLQESELKYKQENIELQLCLQGQQLKFWKLLMFHAVLYILVIVFFLLHLIRSVSS